MSLAAVTLDAVGTLFAPCEPVGATYVRIAAAHGVVLDAVAVGVRFRAALRAAPPLAFPGVPTEVRGRTERAWWRSVVQTAFGNAAHHSGFEAAFDELWGHFARPEAWRLDEGVLATLQALRADGLRLAVVSNFDGRLVPLLRGLGIAPLVDGVLPSGSYGFAKPDPRLFHTAAAFLGARPGDVLHVGDDVDVDVRGALAAGLGAALVAADGAAAPPGTLVLRRLRDLPDALAGR